MGEYVGGWGRWRRSGEEASPAAEEGGYESDVDESYDGSQTSDEGEGGVGADEVVRTGVSLTYQKPLARYLDNSEARLSLDTPASSFSSTSSPPSPPTATLSLSAGPVYSPLFSGGQSFSADFNLGYSGVSSAGHGSVALTHKAIHPVRSSEVAGAHRAYVVGGDVPKFSRGGVSVRGYKPEGGAGASGAYELR